jgi:hypothetical protein
MVGFGSDVSGHAAEHRGVVSSPVVVSDRPNPAIQRLIQAPPKRTAVSHRKPLSMNRRCPWKRPFADSQKQALKPPPPNLTTRTRNCLDQCQSQ